MDPARGDAKSERKEEEKQAKRQESVSSSDNDDGEDDFFQLDQELTNPFLGHLNDGRIATSSPQSADGRLSSPPVQMMWRSPDAPDQNRIPSSIFDRPSSPKEWSAASNESLFSIHGGNSSFTRDHIGLMEKSGELNLPEEDHHHHSPRALPADPAGAETDNAKSIKELVQANAEEQQHRSSDCSAVSYQSFAFPILAGDGRTVSGKVESVHPFRPSKSQHKQPPPAAAPPKPATPPPPTSPAKKSNWFPCACLPSCCSQASRQ